jgi:hypothetical protein
MLWSDTHVTDGTAAIAVIAAPTGSAQSPPDPPDQEKGQQEADEGEELAEEVRKVLQHQVTVRHLSVATMCKVGGERPDAIQDATRSFIGRPVVPPLWNHLLECIAQELLNCSSVMQAAGDVPTSRGPSRGPAWSRPPRWCVKSTSA